MPRITTVAIALAAAFAAATAGAGPAAARDRCAAASSQTLHSTPLVRAYLDNEQAAAFACFRPTGKRTQLDDDGLLDEGVVASVAGRHVAFAWSSTPACKAACPPGVVGTSGTEVANAATGRIRQLEDFVVAKVVLAASGAVSWLSPPAPGFGSRTLSIWDTKGKRRLDQGRIPLASVRRSGGRLRWTNGPTARSVAMP